MFDFLVGEVMMMTVEDCKDIEINPLIEMVFRPDIAGGYKCECFKTK